MKRKTAIAAAALILVFAATVALSAAKNSKEFVFEVAVPRGLVAGKTAESWSKMLQSLFVVAKEETGIIIKSNIQVSMEGVMNDFDKKIAHISFLLAPDYVFAVDKNAPIKPWISYKVNNTKTFEHCLYVKKGTKAKGAKDLAGKTVAFEGIPKKLLTTKSKYAVVGNGAAIFSRLFLQKMLDEEGVKDRYDKFMKTADTPNVEAAITAVVKGEADAVIASERMIILMVDFHPMYKQLEPVKCVCPAPYSAIVYRTGINDELAEQMKTFLLNIHKRKEFKDFSALSGVEQFLDAKDSDYDSLRKLLKEARAKKWTEF